MQILRLGKEVKIMIGIYKIENKVNGKVYIGQSTNIQIRWKNHKVASQCTKDHTYNYPLYKAFRKYGIDNFIFEIIEECDISELDNREKFWINYYDSYNKGYNQTLGGDGIFGKINNTTLDRITNDLYLSELSINEIAKKYNLSYEMIQGINTGRHWIRNINYPIRKPKEKITHRCIDCGKKITSKATRCVDCYNIYVNKTSNKPSKETLASLILKYSMIKIGEIYDVSSNAIKKWCKSYNLPFTYKDIKQYRIQNNI